MNKVLVIVPAFNEEDNIVKVVRKLNDCCPFADVVVINDCSEDDTVEKLKGEKASVISLPINLGIGGAVQTGYIYARENGYEIAVQHDGDGQHDPAAIKEAVDLIENGIADIVIGSRFIEKIGFQSSFTRRIGITFLSNLIYWLTSNKICDVTSGYRVVNKRFIDLYSQDYPVDYPEPEAIVMALMNRAIVKEIPVVMSERENGESSINLKRSVYYMIKVSLAIIITRLSSKKG